MQEITYRAAPYNPTATRGGDSDLSLLRLKNMLLAGIEPNIYLENYKGSLSLSETIPTATLTGTISGSSGSKTITGVGTSFKSELRSGQFVFAGTELLVIDAISSNTSLTVHRALTAPLSGATAYRMPVLFEINRKRGTQIQGNAVEFDKGTILGTGMGTLRLNGSALSGDSMDFTGGPLIAIFDDATGNYAVYDLGMDTPSAAPVLTSTSGGAKNMQVGHYSIRLVPSRIATSGYNNPGPVAEGDIASSGDQFEVDVSGVSMDSTHGQDAWDVYASQSTEGGIQGPWYFWKTITSADISANTFNAEWLDAEINRSGILEFDNDPPPDSIGFIAVLEGNPVWVSCFGKDGNSPGPSLVPAKPRNIEAAPAEWNVTSSPPETLIGVVTAMARLHLLTPKSLQQGIYAPTGDPLVPPISVRPYWRCGFSNPYQLIYTSSLLIGYTHSGPTRSIANAEEAVEEHAFGAYVSEILKGWTGGHVLVMEDPDPAVNAVCFFHSADSKNTQGYWQTRVLVWGLRQGNWIGDVMISSSTRDMIVCGVASVDNHLEFLAGGRVSGGSVTVDTFRWNTASGSSVDYSATWQLTNGGVANQRKSVKALTVTSKLTSGIFRLFAFESEEDISVTNIESGTNSESGDISLGTDTDVQQSDRMEMVFPDLALFAPQIAGTYSGSGAADRIDKVLVEYIVEGVRR